ncbi:MAG TPA: hypothetical protein VIS56_01895 [Candidatus Saccharimonadales bacterium]
MPLSNDLDYPKIVDRITFLAGLASDSRAIDPILDDVREITSTRDPSLPLQEPDRVRLSAVYAKLEDHLLHNDALRTFTPESLQQLTDKQFGGTTSLLSDARRQLLISLALSATAYIVAVPVLYVSGVAFWWLISGIFAALTLFATTCWLFLSGYRTFTQSLRQAHALFSVTAILVGLSSLLWAVTVTNESIFNIPILKYTGGFIGYIFTFIPAYFGVRALTRVFGVQSRFASPLWIGLLGFAGLAVFMMLPTVIGSDDPYLGTTLSTLWLSSMFCGVIAILARKVSSVMTPGYARAMRYYCYGNLAAVAANTVYQVLIIATGADFGIRLVFTGALYLFPGLLMFISGYFFRLSSVGK